MSKTISIRPLVDPRHPNHLSGNMTAPDESRKKARSVKESSGAENQDPPWSTESPNHVRNLQDTTSPQRDEDILGIGECRWSGSGSVILPSGHENSHTHDIAVMLVKEKAKTLQEWQPGSERLKRPCLNSSCCSAAVSKVCMTCS